MVSQTARQIFKDEEKDVASSGLKKDKDCPSSY